MPTSLTVTGNVLRLVTSIPTNFPVAVIAQSGLTLSLTRRLLMVFHVLMTPRTAPRTAIANVTADAQFMCLPQRFGMILTRRHWQSTPASVAQSPLVIERAAKRPDQRQRLPRTARSRAVLPCIPITLGRAAPLATVHPAPLRPLIAGDWHAVPVRVMPKHRGPHGLCAWG